MASIALGAFWLVGIIVVTLSIYREINDEEE